MIPNHMFGPIEREEFRLCAESGAKKLCNQFCIAPYACGNQKEPYPGAPNPVCTGETCPVAKYHAYNTNDDKWWEHHASEQYTSEDEIFALCALCENSVVKQSPEDEDVFIATRVELWKCLDCPVKMVEESMQENAAEAAMS